MTQFYIRTLLSELPIYDHNRGKPVVDVPPGPLIYGHIALRSPKRHYYVSHRDSTEELVYGYVVDASPRLRWMPFFLSAIVAGGSLDTDWAIQPAFNISLISRTFQKLSRRVEFD